MDVIRGFERFFVNSNVLGLAVAVVFGKVFGKLIESSVQSILYPLFLRTPLLFDDFFSKIVNFIVTILVMYLLIIKPLESKIQENDDMVKKQEQKKLAKIVEEVFDKKFLATASL